MANYSQLKAAIADVIKTNGTQAITGQVLQDVLNSMVSVIGANYTFAGVATPSTNPGTPDQNVVYIASLEGTYTNFNNIELSAGLSLLMWNGSWSSQTFFEFSEQQLSVVNGGYPLSFSDDKGNVGLAVDDEGFVVTKIKHLNGEVAKYPISFSDEVGNVGFAVNEKGFGLLRLSDIQDRKVSILGDSISTYNGYLPSDEEGYDGASYATYYPAYGINDVRKTWWYKFLARKGATLLRNCSWSNSGCCGNSQSTTSAEIGSSDRRIADLSKDGVQPDIIINYIGINDFKRNKLVGSWNGGSLPLDGTVNVFSEAYALMVYKEMMEYPNAKIYCCTLADTAHSAIDLQDPTTYPCENDNHETLSMYNTAIRNVAQALGAMVVELHSAGITYFNCDDFTGDLLHPNVAGAELIAKKMELSVNL